MAGVARAPLIRPTSRSAIEVPVYSRCAGPRRIVVAVTQPHAVRRRLTARGLGLAAEPPPLPAGLKSTYNQAFFQELDVFRTVHSNAEPVPESETHRS
jgi:hypothetical protein